VRRFALVFGVVLSTLIGCVHLPATDDEAAAKRETQRLEQKLEAYHLELARLVAAGDLTTEQAEKFYQIARAETARRIAQLAEQHRAAISASPPPASQQTTAASPPGLAYSPP
jgi:endonuclease/exonuclease/phosphatase family metal-dependent hydrolase